MAKKKLMKTAKYLRYTARTVLLIVASFWFVFALLSGSEEYGGGLKGILMNSPNALPWLLLFAFVYVAWRWELIGGILVALMGLYTAFFFDALESPIVFLLISVPLMLLGGLFIASWHLTKNIK
jgi:hypothetical protein